MLWVRCQVEERVVEGEILGKALKDLVLEIRKTRELGEVWRVMIRTYTFGETSHLSYEIVPDGLTLESGWMPFIARSNYSITLTKSEEALVEKVIEENRDSLNFFEIE